MRKSVFVIASLFLSSLLFSQVAKKVVVEHFTNTRCSVCASRNPSFYTNLNAQTGVIHLAIHPSSPYSSCVLNQHNTPENDARTNYYGIYGSTPRLVIQGAVISSGTNYGAASMFTPYLSQQSPASIKIVQTKFGNDSIRSRIVIKTEATHSLTGLSLFVALAEDTLNYTGSNGESVHYDVFRKSLTGATGVSITLPSNVGDSVVYSKSSSTNTAWNFSRIFTIAILQQTSNKEVIQSNWAKGAGTQITSLNEVTNLNENISIYSFNKTITLRQNKLIENMVFELYDLSGRKVGTNPIQQQTTQLNFNHIESGIYLYKIIQNGIPGKTGKLIL